MRLCRGRRVRGNRRGATLIEVAVIVFLLVLLGSLVLPSLVVSHGDSRKSECINNLRNLGVAMIDYVDCHGHFPASGAWELPQGRNWKEELADPIAMSGSPRFDQNATGKRKGYGWVYDILARIDRSDVKEVLDTEDIAVNANEGDSKPMQDSRTETTRRGSATSTYIRLLVCPADDTCKPDRGNLSYVVNGGLSPRTDLWPDYSDVDSTLPDSGAIKNALFRCGLFSFAAKEQDKRHGFKSVKDGHSSTIMMSENVHVGHAQATTFLGGQTIVEELNWSCPHPASTSFFLQTPLNSQSRRGRVVVPGLSPKEWRFSAANTRGHDSGGINGNISPGNESRFPYPTSLHQGGVHVLMVDGGVTFIEESMDGAVWAAMVTPDWEGDSPANP